MVYQSKAYNFVLRLISACVLAPIVLFVTKLGGLYFTCMLLMGAIIMGGEWSQMTIHKRNIWKIMGVPFILIPIFCLLWMIEQVPSEFTGNHINGTDMVISIFVFVWANDIGGYICGKVIGGYKLAPKISPNKTIAGFIGGVIFAIAVTPFMQYGAVFAAFVAVVASIGDLIESWIKRKCDVKDSGAIIPGHGGVLDRVDGVLLVAVVVAFSMKFFS